MVAKSPGTLYSVAMAEEQQRTPARDTEFKRSRSAFMYFSLFRDSRMKRRNVVTIVLRTGTNESAGGRMVRQVTCREAVPMYHVFARDLPCRRRRKIHRTLAVISSTAPRNAG